MGLVLPLLSLIAIFLLMSLVKPDWVDTWKKSNLNPLKDIRHYLIFLAILGLMTFLFLCFDII